MHICLKSFSIAGLVLFGTAAIAQSLPQIKTREDFVKLVDGRTSDGDVATTRWTSDGKVTGTTNSGKKMVGAWEWHTPYLCYNINIDGTPTGTMCGTYFSDGTNTLFIRDKGKGRRVAGKFR